MTSSTNAARDLLIGPDGSSAKPKLLYFGIEGVAEQVRIALSIANVPFDDVTFPFPEWSTIKPTTKYGQVPELTLPDGAVITDSQAMLRLAGEADEEGKLYPLNDVNKRMKIEMALGLVGDLARSWRPCIYVGMRPEKFGYPPRSEWADGDVVIQKLRENFLIEELPRYMGYLADMINVDGNGKYLTGEDMTIADISAYQQISYFRKGIADHVPKDCLEQYPEIMAWLGRVEGHPKFAAYKANKEASK
jgi:glutathione S-transferase